MSSRNGFFKNCKTCGKKFYVYPSSEKHDAHDYCSSECWYKALPKINEAKRPKKICKHCGKEYSYVKGTNGKYFCSPECRYADWRGKNSPLRKPKMVKICQNCGNEFEIYPSWVKKGEGKYCSKKCQSEHQGKIYVGENHPNWRGGHDPYYGPNWRRQRRAARKRDKYTCQECGITENKLGRELDVHHIQPFRLFNGDWKAANKLDNLLSLCPTCHTNKEWQDYRNHYK